MALSPFRPQGVVVRWPYLGISAGTRRLEVEGEARRWGAPEYRRMVAATWAKAVEKARTRSA
eukprot:10353257-Alexandrium_andersonii.AAC.1